MTLLDLAGNRDGVEDDNDDLHEAWPQDDHHQGEDLRRLHDPRVRRRLAGGDNWAKKHEN